MQIKRLATCPVCGAKYMEGAAAGGCPICSGGGKTGIVRPLDESGPPPQQPQYGQQGAAWPGAAQQDAARHGVAQQVQQRAQAPREAAWPGAVQRGQQQQPQAQQSVAWLGAAPQVAQNQQAPQGAAPPVQQAQYGQQGAAAHVAQGVQAPLPLQALQDAGMIQGWLVSVSGAGRGEYFRIVAEKNLIGGEKDGRVAVFYDQTEGEGVSGMIICDAEAGAFWLLNGCGRNLVRLNGELLLDAVRLKKGDVLKVGGTELVFVPFCGSEFRWAGATADPAAVPTSP